MSQFNLGPKSFKADTDIPRHSRVKIKSQGVVEIAAVDEFAIGFTEELAEAGLPVAVRLVNTGGTIKAIANETIAVNVPLFGGDDGKVQSTDPGSGVPRFLSLEAASENNSIFEILPTSNA